jgi:hypothetical protein
MFEVIITGDTADDIRRKMEEFIGKPGTTTTSRSAWEVVNAADLQELLMAIDARLYAEGYAVIKKERFLEKRTAEGQS